MALGSQEPYRKGTEPLGRITCQKGKFSKIPVNFRYDLNSTIPILPDTFSPVIPGEPAGRPRLGQALLLGHPAAPQFGSSRTLPGASLRFRLAVISSPAPGFSPI